jgi:hypothetical protein
MLKFYNKNNQRYYFIAIEKDLFDDWILCVNRGGDRRHVVRRYGYSNLSSLNARLNDMIKKRLQRGYELI